MLEQSATFVDWRYGHSFYFNTKNENNAMIKCKLLLR